MVVLAGGQEHDAGEEEAEALNRHVVVGGKALDPVLDEEHHGQREEREQQEKQHPPAGGHVFGGETPGEEVPQQGKRLENQVGDGAAEDDEHGDQRTRVEQDGEEEPGVAAVPGEILEKGEVSRAGHGEKFGQALQDALQKRLQHAHGRLLYVGRGAPSGLF